MALSSRKPNTTKEGGAWTEATKLAIWKKGKLIPDFDASIWRWDAYGSVIKFSEYSNRNSDYGWEIDHINPIANGGTDDSTNLQPLQWKNNADKSDNLNWKKTA